MNINNPNSPAAALPPHQLIPPQIPRYLPLGESPEDREPITGPLAAVEAILRQPRRVMYQLRQPGSGSLMGAMLLVAMLCALVYGVVVGTFSMGPQLWVAPAKICMGLLISAIICLPSLYIFTCLSGCKSRLGEICGLVAGLLLLMTILLVGFAPVAWLFSQSTQSLAWMGTLHIVFWLISTFFGLRFLHAAFQHSNSRSNAGLFTWIVIFVLVALQMTTALRPIIGKADSFLPTKKMFFLSYWSECINAEAGPSDQRKSRAD